MKSLRLLLALAATLLTTACSTVEQVRTDYFGLQAYVYGLPLVMMDVTREVTTATATTGEYKAPINQFGRMRTVVSPDFKDVVRISVNSIWSFGFLDLEAGPMVVTIPDTQGRYVVMQALDMWTDNFASVGTRTPTTNAGDYLIAGPNWTGTAPAGVRQVFRSSTRHAWVLVQMSSRGPQDLPAIHALQDQLMLTPLAAWGKPYSPPASVPIDPAVDLTATPYDQVRMMTGEMFFTRLARLLKDNPPKPADAKALEWLRKIGVEPGKAFDASQLNAAELKGLNKVPSQVWMKLAQGVYEAPTVNGWMNQLNLGRYGTDYETRALVAWLGLGALTSDDAIYPSAFLDADGKALDGRNAYVIRFDKGALPPSGVNVWSISPYRENFYVRNAAENYGVLSSAPFVFNADGSLDIYVQATSPGKDKEANWVASPPSGAFNLTVRIYQPKKEALDGSYKLPPVRRLQTP